MRVYLIILTILAVVTTGLTFYGLSVLELEVNKVKIFLKEDRRYSDLTKQYDQILEYLFMLKGKEAAKDGNIESAMIDFNKILEINPSANRVNYEMAQMAYGNGDYDLALDYAFKEEKLNDWNTSNDLLIGEIYIKKKSYVLAVNYFDKILKANPHQPQATSRLAEAYRKLDQPKKAYDLLESYLKVKKADDFIRYKMLMAAVEGGQKQAIRPVVQSNLKKAPNNGFLHLVKSVLEFQEGNDEVAVEHLSKARLFIPAGLWALALQDELLIPYLESEDLY